MNVRIVVTSNPPYTFVKDSIYYFQKTIPVDLQHHYKSKRISFSLRTRSKRRAEETSRAIESKLNAYWLNLRLSTCNLPGSHLLKSSSEPTPHSNAPTLTESLDVYIKLKGAGRSEYFITTAKRNIDYVIKCLGCRPIDQYTSADAAKYRDWLVEKGLASSSVKRVFSSVKAIVNLAINELGVDSKNAFAGVYLASRGDAKKRKPLSNDSLKHLQNACIEADDDLRWLVAMISDTGMRLAEAAGLHVDDIVLGGVPYVYVKPHTWRSLTTASSERKIPLVGASLWAAQRVKAMSNSYCFSRYVDGTKCNSNSASAALNKWLKTATNQDVVIHGLRHKFRDRLRAVEAQLDMIDQLGGWSLQSVGQGYGDGYSIEKLSEWMQKITEG
jgi:integrase